MARPIVASLFVASLLCFAGSTANAGIIVNSLDFTRTSGNASIDVANHLSVDVVSDSADPNKVLFIFRLSDDLDASSNPRVSNVFFEDGVLGSILGLGDADDLLSFAGFAEDAGVDFSSPGNQSDLAAGNFTASFSAGADSPNPNVTAINEGESLGVLFGLDPGTTYLDLLDEMAAGDTQVGVKITSRGAGSFVSDPLDIVDVGASPVAVAVVPEPISFVTWGGGALCVVLGRRLIGRKNRKVC